MKKNSNNITMEKESNWKTENKDYLNELQKFLDKAANIENEELRDPKVCFKYIKEIIIQMLKCDKELTKAAERKIEEASKQEKKC